jgi:hypothetical protein
MTSSPTEGLAAVLRHLISPRRRRLLAAMFERLQSQSMSEVIGQPRWRRTPAACRPRAIWRDALKGALGPIAAVYGLVVGTLLSGSFAVEAITAAGPRPAMLARPRARRIRGGRAVAGSSRHRHRSCRRRLR